MEKAPFEAGKRVLTAAAHSSWDTDLPTSQALDPDGAKCKKISLLPKNIRETMQYYESNSLQSNSMALLD